MKYRFKIIKVYINFDWIKLASLHITHPVNEWWGLAMFCENINQELEQKLSVYVSKDFSG